MGTLTRYIKFWWDEYKYPVAVFAIIKAVTLIVALTGALFLERNTEILKRNLFLDIWIRWDGGWYMDLAKNGYYFQIQPQNNTTTFPFLPVLTRWMTFITCDYKVSAVILVSCFFLAALLLLFNIVKNEFGPDVAKKTVLYLAISPGACIYSMFYAEAAFLALVLASFYFAFRNNWLLASLFGLLVSMTRSTGIIIFPALLAEYFLRVKKGRVKFRITEFMPVLCVPLGYALVVLMQYAATGDWAAYLHTKKMGWNSYFVFPWVTVQTEILRIRSAFSSGSAESASFIGLVVNFITAFCFLSLTPFLFRKVSISYFILALLGVCAPFFFADFTAMPRYVIVLFPYFIMFALWGKRSEIFDLAYMLVSLPLFGLFLGLFVSHRFCF